MKTIILLILSCFISRPVYCQLNDTINYHLNYAGTGIINKTNDGNSYNLNNNVRFNISKKQLFMNTSNSWIYGIQSNKVEKNLTNNDFSSVIDFNLFKTINNFYYWGLGSFDKSYSLKIDNRVQAGLGIGYSVLNNANITVTLSDGVLYEKSDLYDLEAYEILRNSFRLKFRFVYKNMIVLDGTDFYQNSLANSQDYIVKSISNLSFKINKLLSLTSSVTYNKLSLTQKENLLITFGLSLDKYF
ncbi:MAG: DUF481 domain-containing protein [Opitutaceae bacterium]|nr:DUF481 domain-containing protein [Cytophagales bacterium]